MKLELFSAEANNIWKKAASNPTAEKFNFEVDIHKRLLSFFQVGYYYYFIFNIATLDIEFASNEIEMVLGYQPSEFNISKLLDIIHQDDRPFFLNFENKAGEFLTMLPVEKLTKYKVRYDYRIQKKDGGYLRVLQQSTAIEQDENGRLIRTLSVHTDITHLKSDGKPVLSFIGLNGEPSYINVDVEEVFSVTKDFLSRREKQVLILLIEGKLSKEIGNILNISKQTVDNHRKNMIARNNFNNTAELISNAIRRGWI